MVQQTVSLPQLRKDVQEALKAWHKESVAGSTLDYLQLFRQQQRESPRNIRQTANQLLFDGIQQMEAEKQDHAKVLRMRFLDNLTVEVTANQMNMADSTLYDLQKQAIDHLTQLLFDRESVARQAHQTMLASRLEPPTYVNLIGITPALQELEELLMVDGPPWLISLEGLGGIGKTSLTDALVRRLLGHGIVEDLAWVTARQAGLNLGGGIEFTGPALSAETFIQKLIAQLVPDPLSALRLTLAKQLALLESHLAANRSLVVIDNLETLVDVKSLLPMLQRLVNPTKFILTSRERLYTEPNVFHFSVQPLTEPDALALLRQEARLSNLSELAASPDSELKPIVDTVGGNPLALRLIVGQAHIHAVDAILLDLMEARGETAENLYTFIYKRAWENLDEVARLALITMPLVGEKGDTIEFLAEMSELSIGELRRALSQLVTFNLVNVSGDLHTRRYTIHSLTRTFLHQQVVQWHYA